MNKQVPDKRPCDRRNMTSVHFNQNTHDQFYIYSETLQYTL